MDERRRATRQRVFKAGTIAFNRAAGIDCIIKNLSDTGACLEVASPLGIPEAFVLVTDAGHNKRPCHIVWRKEKRLGICFD
jgi:hypothetical protein